jgi:exonuclease III
MDLLRFVFWNVNTKDLTYSVCALAKSTKADVIILAENLVRSHRTLGALRQDVNEQFFIPDVISESRFHCFSRDANLDLSEVHSANRISIRRWKLGTEKALLVLVHGVDIRNHDRETRQSFAEYIAGEIRFVSKEQKIKNIVVMGDFNMNPYDPGMYIARGLNAMMTRKCVARGVRQHTGGKYDLYYNPMWSLFGDNSKGPAGTVYDTSSQGPYGWNILDQVIIHHSLVPFFKDVKILSAVDGHSFANQYGRPDKKNVSDHFPILTEFRRTK